VFITQNAVIILSSFSGGLFAFSISLFNHDIEKKKTLMKYWFSFICSLASQVCSNYIVYTNYEKFNDLNEITVVTCLALWLQGLNPSYHFAKFITSTDEFTWIRENLGVHERRQVKLDKARTLRTRQMFILLTILSAFAVICPYELYTIISSVSSWKRYYLTVIASCIVCLFIDLYFFNIVYYKRRFSGWDYVLCVVPFPIIAGLCYATTIIGYDGYLIYSLIVSAPTFFVIIVMFIYNHRNELKDARIVVVEGKPMIELPLDSVPVVTRQKKEHV